MSSGLAAEDDEEGGRTDDAPPWLWEGLLPSGGKGSFGAIRLPQATKCEKRNTAIQTSTKWIKHIGRDLSLLPSPYKCSHLLKQSVGHVSSMNWEMPPRPPSPLSSATTEADDSPLGAILTFLAPEAAEGA